MNSNIINQNAYLRSQIAFPEEPEELVFEISKTYVDIANAVNNRTVSLFPTNKRAITGESWFLHLNRRQQTLRQVYNLTSTTAINHNINFPVKGLTVRGFGSYSEIGSNNTYGLIFGTNIAIAGVISFYVTLTQIVFNVGAGAPALDSGIIVLEWLSEP